VTNFKKITKRLGLSAHRAV